MSRLLAIFAGLLGIVLVPLALSSPTALLLVPAHLAFAVLVCAGAIVDALDGWPERARRWGLFFLVATAAMVGALEVGARVRGSGVLYWAVPWVAAALWSWIPPVVSGFAGWFASARQGSRTRKIVRVRRGT